MIWLTFGIAALMAIAPVTACAAAEIQQGVEGLLGPTWRLVRYGAVTAPKSVPPGRRGPWGPATLRFGVSQTSNPPPAGEDSLSASDGCNEVFGLSYRTNAGRLVVTFSKGWGTTLKACPVEHEPQKAAFYAGLRGSERFMIDGKTLTILYDDGKSALVFE